MHQFCQMKIEFEIFSGIRISRMKQMQIAKQYIIKHSHTPSFCHQVSS